MNQLTTFIGFAIVWPVTIALVYALLEQLFPRVLLTKKDPV